MTRTKQHKAEDSISMNSIAKTHENSNIEVIKNTGEILLDVAENGKERPWQKHKVSSEELTIIFKRAKKIEPMLISEKRLKSLEECASFLLFDRDVKQKLRLSSANFCRLRLCPMCSWRKSLKLFGQVLQIVNIIQAKQRSTRYIFVTFTVPNCTSDELTKTINKMNQALAYLLTEKKKFAPARKIYQNLLGYMKALEVTYNQQTDTYHPHFHCLLAVKASYFTYGYVEKSEWQAIWSQAMKSERELIVDVEAVKNSTAKAVAEVAKYPVKSTDLLKITDEEQATKALIVLHKTLLKRQLVRFGGIFADVKKQLNLQDVDSQNVDLIHTDTESNFEAVEKVLFKWCKIGAYIC